MYRPEKNIESFSTLGSIISCYFNKDSKSRWNDTIEKVIDEQYIYNPWFTKENVEYSLKEWSRLLNTANLNKWLTPYSTLFTGSKEKKSDIGIIAAGNIPLAVMHDFVSVLISGNRFVCKLSSKDNRLLPLLASILTEIDPDFRDKIRFTDNLRNKPDAIIATGTDNSARYFRYYFSGIPTVIRANRNSAAVLNGNETDEELKLLSEDVFLYFGLGCRNVSKLFVPENYSFENFFKNAEHWNHLALHNKYANNYFYQRSVLLMNKEEFLDNGFLIVKPDEQFYSPLSVIFYEYFSDISIFADKLNAAKTQIQCIVSNEQNFLPAVRFGKSQCPELWDYADDIDTLKFLLTL